MINRQHPLPVVHQCQVLAIARSSSYYTPRAVSAADLALMWQIDGLQLEYPFAGSRMLRDLLRQDGASVGRRYVVTLMRKMGIEVKVLKIVDTSKSKIVERYRRCVYAKKVR